MQLLDPRGQLRLERVPIAPRLTADALASGAVLFYDNLKMDVGRYGVLFPRIREGLQQRGIRHFIDHRETIRGKSPEGIAALARKLADLKPAAAVIALADMGVSPAMVALTIALEKAGIPTACLTAQPGSALAAAHAHYRAGALCLIDLDIFPASDTGDVARAADECVEAVVAALTQGASKADAYPIDVSVRAEPVEARTDEDAYQAFDEIHIGDGLPIVAPTAERFERMREYCPFDPDEVIASGVGPSGTPIRVRDVLVAAIMAGCRPQYAPIVLTALRALVRPEYGLIQAVTTTFSGGHFVLVSGPIAQEVGLHGGAGCLGPGFRANATIGRAVNLTLLNVCRSVPGHADLACLSSPAEFTYCFAEDPALSPWPTLNVERYDPETTCVMVLKAEAPHNVLDIGSTTGEALLETYIDCSTTLGSNNASNAGPLVLVLNPDHARILARDGYDKPRIRREVHAGARIPLERIRARGIVSVAAQDHAQGFQYVTRSPQDVQVVVAGGKGGHSAVLLPWALYSDAVFEPVTLPDGRPARTIADFHQNRGQTPISSDGREP